MMFCNITVLFFFSKIHRKTPVLEFFNEDTGRDSSIGISLYYFCHLIHFCGCLLSSFQAVMSSVLFIFQKGKRDSKKSSGHVLFAASLTPRAASLKISRYI